MTGQDMFEVRNSPVHGLGVFALRAISKGTRLVEYLGERVSHAEADRRYEGKAANDSHTFLFIVDNRTVIDAGVDGNEARFFNHSCDPNCESVIEKRRVYIETIREVAAGEEMTYDYQIQREHDDPPNIDEVFACRCGFAQCRGTMLWPADPPKATRARKKKRARRTEAPARSSRPERSHAAAKSTARKTGRAGTPDRSGKTARRTRDKRAAPHTASRQVRRTRGR